MKKSYLLLWAFLLLPSVYVYSLDVILTKARMQIQCNIISQDENTVTYQLLNSQDKELYTIEKADIEKIYPHIEEATIHNEPKVEPQKEEEKVNDVIVLKDGTRIDVVLVEVTDNQVKYRKTNNPEGPLFVKEIANITSIIYANGEREDFNHSSQKAEATIVKKDEAKPTTIDAGKSGRIYRDNGHYLYNETYISSKEVARILQRENAAAYKKWQKADGMLIGGAVCIGVGGGLVIGGIFPAISGQYGPALGLELSALVPLGIGLGLTLGASSHYNKAIDIYNSKFDQAAVQLRWGVSANGLGLAIAF